MNTKENNRDKDLFNILSSIKLIALLLCVVLLINQYTRKLKLFSPPVNSTFAILIILSYLILFIVIYGLWYLMTIRAFNSKYNKQLQIAESLFFIFLFTSLMNLYGSVDNQYKFIFILIIIISSLQLGMNFGLITAIISSLIILLMDIYYAPHGPVNIYFEKDLVLVGVFLSVALVLGHYVRLESEKLSQKNLLLKELSDELEEQNKQRKYIEDILFKNENCYNLLFNSSQNSIIVHRNNEIIFASDSCARLLGFNESSELRNKDFSELAVDSDKDYVQDKLNQIGSNIENLISFEEGLLRQDGQIVMVLNTSTEFIYEGKRTILSIFRDITSEKKVKKLQEDVQKNVELLNETRELNRLITEFFSNISHELKTPLNVIYSAVQVLNMPSKETPEEAMYKQDKYLKVIKQNCHRLLRLINNLLDMTRLDSGFIKLNPENLNIVSIIEDITLSVVPYFESKNLNLTFDTNTEERIMAFDPDKIERIILNLLSNAYKFTNPGGEIYISLEDNTESIVISIKDTGMGIPADKLGLIFERFGQVDRTLRRLYEGSGIGLSLVKSFVELHEGSIELRSTVGEGSEFIIKLPIKTFENVENKEISSYETNIERINIEFSDIYSSF